MRSIRGMFCLYFFVNLAGLFLFFGIFLVSFIIYLSLKSDKLVAQTEIDTSQAKYSVNSRIKDLSHRVRPSLKHYKDGKEMLLIKSDFVIYGQSDDSSQNNFNPYYDDRNPKHLIHLAAYYMDKYEVSNAEYLYFCKQSAYPLPDAWSKNGTLPNNKRADHPFQLASYENAQAYAKWSGKRLPTELEWEMAARGGLLYWLDKKPSSIFRRPPLYSSGAKFDPQTCNTLESGRGDSLAVYDLADKSPYGIIGLCGNVREWTSSWYAPYKGHRFENILSKTSLSNYRIFKVLRGGSFTTNKELARADSRSYGGIPNLATDYSAGFRLVINPKY